MPKSALMRPFSICIQSGEMAVRDALAKVLTGLGPLDLDIEEAGTVELVLAEALNNIVEHAYAPPLGCGPIRIRCVHRPDGLHLRIVDEGSAMPEGHKQFGERARPDAAIDELAGGGFGWFLIRDLAKDVRYCRKGHTNRLDLRLSVALQ